jgi:hypothetical protein
MHEALSSIHNQQKCHEEKRLRRLQDGSEREEAESMPSKVKSWRDAEDTPYRKNH